VFDFVNNVFESEKKSDNIIIFHNEEINNYSKYKSEKELTENNNVDLYRDIILDDEESYNYKKQKSEEEIVIKNGVSSINAGNIFDNEEIYN
jgi:hypothetical protein